MNAVVAERWWLGILFSLALWPAPALAQDDSWENQLSAGRAAYQRGNYAEAEKDFMAAVRIAEQFGDDDPRLASSLSNLASFYHNLWRFGEAEPLFRRALMLREKTLGPDHTDVAISLRSLAELHYAQGRYGEAEILSKRALVIFEKALGPEHRLVVGALSQLAGVYNAQGRYPEAVPLYKRVVAILEKTLGPEHMLVASALAYLARLYDAQGHHAEAEPLYKRALAILGKALGPENAHDAVGLNDLAALYDAQGRDAVAETLAKRALAVAEKTHGPEHPLVANGLNSLAAIYSAQGRYAEAEPLNKRALAILERSFGLEHPNVAVALNRLARLYYAQRRYSEAEPLFERSLTISEKILGSEHPDVAATLGWLAGVYLDQGRYADAEPLYKRALVVLEKALGPEHSLVAAGLTNVAEIYREQGRYGAAEPLYRRALSIVEKVRGADSEDAAAILHNLVGLYVAQGRYTEAEPLSKRALAIQEKVHGPGHPDLAQSQGALGAVYFREGRYIEALNPIRQATSILRTRFIGGESERELWNNRSVFLAHLAVLQRVMHVRSSGDQALLDEALEAMELSHAKSVAASVAQMAARFAAGSDALAVVVRERQDAAARWHALDAQLTATAAEHPAARNPQAEVASRAALGELDAKIKQLDERLAREFPAYAEISSPRPLSLDELQNLLAPDEALLAYAVWTDRSFLMAVRRDQAELFELAIGADALRAAVAELRASLTPEGIRTTGQLRERGFPATRAFELYTRLFAPAEKVLQGTRLVFVVPDGALQSLPVGVLLTDEPQGPFAEFSDYAQAPWLARKYAMTVLPGISSLRALRRFAGAAKAGVPFRGVGNPKLGPAGSHRAPALAELFRGPLADPAVLQQLSSLPETEQELREMAKALGGDARLLLTGAAATETAVKKGALSKARVVAFATHTAVAGQITGLSEPAIVLTPPAKPSEMDDGLLTASEVARDLALDADWVVLSACNTAAADGTPGAEGLSGLAKAFFYAGARALLVSHWSVESHASVRLTTGAFHALAETPGIGRAEALRRSMLALLADQANPHYAHPMFWGPFVLVGEGAANQ